ncbi:MAG: prepilin peptidase [Nitrospinae bacterium CG11_big_fil_rev_8_21_14_0_20_56_8]|nr:MAG: prepilin peptidase [Nitrospinae bacterium CG11_big_fil_rev_8_21_14_0_20_56_8]
MELIHPLPHLFQAGFIFMIGLAVGSFANVCIYRIPKGESIVFPASHCPSCNQPIPARDNIPVLSFLLLGGRCRFCKTTIGRIYPVIEILTAVLITSGFLRLGPTPEFVIFMVLGPALVIITAIDLQHKIIPNLITLPGILFGLAGGIYLEGVTSSLIGLVLGSGIFLIIGEVYFRIRGDEGMGMGDVKYIAGAGALLGWQKILLVIFIGALLGSIVGVAGMVEKKLNYMSQIPFGPFLAAGTLIAFFWGDQLIHLYLAAASGRY